MDSFVRWEAFQIISEERNLGHGKLADSLEHISVTEKPRFTVFGEKNSTGMGVSSLPTSKRDNSQLVSFVPRELLKHHMVLPSDVEKRLQSIEKEYAAKDRLGKYNLVPKRKILLHGSPGSIYLAYYLSLYRMARWVASQKGLLVDFPQRQRATRFLSS